MHLAMIACLLAAGQSKAPPPDDELGFYLRGYGGDWAAPGFDFNATRVIGKRQVQGRDVAIGGLELGVELGRRYFSFFGVERGEAGDLALETVSIGAGADLDIGERGGMSIRLSPYGAVMAGTLDVDQPDFGSFRTGFGGRVGVDLGFPIVGRLSIDAFLEARVMFYDYRAQVIDGDENILAIGGAVGLAVGIRF